VVNTWDILEPLPALAPETPICTTVQAKVVPETLLVKAIDGATPEQTVCELGVATTSGVGFTVIVTVLGVPVHPFAFGLMVYIAVPEVLPVVVNTWDILEPLPALAPETPVCTTVQAKVVPETLLVKAIDGATAEQIVCELGVATTLGGGFTVIATVIGVPGHPFAVGVMVYTAVPALLPEFVNTCDILEPLPALAPDTPVCTTVHAKVVPETLLVNAMDGATPEQTACEDGVATTLGIGFPVIVTVMGEPWHPFAVGVMV
jgi:hypothetical protein